MNHSPLHSKRAAFAPTDFLLSLFKATLLAAAASKPAAVTGGAGVATCLCSQHKHPICLKWHRVRSGLVLMPGDSPFLFSHLPAGTLSKQQKFLTLVLFLSTKPHKSLKRKTHTLFKKKDTHTHKYENPSSQISAGRSDECLFWFSGWYACSLWNQRAFSH